MVYVLPLPSLPDLLGAAAHRAEDGNDDVAGPVAKHLGEAKRRATRSNRRTGRRLDEPAVQVLNLPAMATNLGAAEGRATRSVKPGSNQQVGSIES
jgi:methyl coenzyme M reductase subunit C